MMAKNGPSRGVKGAWRRFMKAKIGPVPAPVVVVGAIAAIYLWHKRSQAAGGAASASSGDPFAGPDTSGGAAGSGSSGSSGGVGGIVGPPVNQVIRRRVTVNRRVFVTKLPNGQRRVRRPDRPNAPHRNGGGNTAGGDRHGPPVTFRGRGGGRVPHVPINAIPALKGH